MFADGLHKNSGSSRSTNPSCKLQNPVDLAGRHSEGGNILFVAGHVSNLTKSELDVIRNSEGGSNSAYLYPGFDIWDRIITENHVCFCGKSVDKSAG